MLRKRAEIFLSLLIVGILVANCFSVLPQLTVVT